MPAFNFKQCWAHRVRLGLLRPDHPHAKRQTIRARRADGRDPQPGQPITLYTGQRTPFCIKLGDAVLKGRTPVRIVGGRFYQVHVPYRCPGQHTARLRELTPDEIVQLALDDGFNDIDAFFSFFSPQGETFNGFIFNW